MTTVRPQFPGPLRILRLRGALQENPTARILHVLLIGLVLWAVLHATVFMPRFIVRRSAASVLLIYLAVSAIVALVLLRRGSLRNASTVYLCGVGVLATILIAFSGGSLSPALVLYASIPISAAWLLGYRAALVASLVCLLIPLAMGVSEALGAHLPRYFTGTPLGNWSVFLLATIIAALPVMVVLRTLNESLNSATRWITELRQTQDELRRERDLVKRIMETSPVGIIAINREGRIHFVNSSGERIFGLSRAEVTLRAHNDPRWNATSHTGDHYPDDQYPFRQVQTHGRPLHDVRLAILRPDGQRVLLSVNAAPVWAADGNFDGMVASMEDVTERARVDRELRKYREGLEELVRQRTEELVAARDQALSANKAKSAFLANISHELRTPLNTILGFASLLVDAEGLRPQHVAKLRMIHRSGEHLLELINDVLDTAKIEAGRATVDSRPTDLNDLAARLSDMMRPRAEEKGLELVVEKTASFPGFALLDGAKLRQILINLVSNAIKYTPSGQVSLRLDAETAGGLRLKLEVADTGIGVAVEDQERIFQPFVQLAGGAVAGTGLGLSLTRQYAQIMGGSIGVESVVGKGSVFRVILPAGVVDSAQAGQTEKDTARVTGLVPGQRRFRVLVVEDDRENRVLLQELLGRAGFGVRAARNGEEAVEEFRSRQPDFIWMDWRLPVLNGEQATRAIRRLPSGRKVKIAAVTASVLPDERAAIVAAGVDELVCKPFRPEDVFGCMARLLGVRYTYAQTSVAPSAAFDLHGLEKLPEALRRELADAIACLDISRVTQAIGRASELDRELGAALAYHSDSLAFTGILRALKTARQMVGEEAI
jgi:PAS domain S-box-containing protein